MKLKKNDKKVTAYVPFDGSLNYVSENDAVLISGLGRGGRAVGDMPGVKYKCVTVDGTSLRALYLGKRGKRWGLRRRGS